MTDVSPMLPPVTCRFPIEDAALGGILQETSDTLVADDPEATLSLEHGDGGQRTFTAGSARPSAPRPESTWPADLN